MLTDSSQNDVSYCRCRVLSLDLIFHSMLLTACELIRFNTPLDTSLDTSIAVWIWCLIAFRLQTYRSLHSYRRLCRFLQSNRIFVIDVACESILLLIRLVSSCCRWWGNSSSFYRLIQPSLLLVVSFVLLLLLLRSFGSSSFALIDALSLVLWEYSCRLDNASRLLVSRRPWYEMYALPILWPFFENCNASNTATQYDLVASIDTATVINSLLAPL